MHCITHHDPANWLKASWSHRPRFVLVEDGSHSDIDLELGFLILAKVFRRLFSWNGSKEEKRWEIIYDLFEVKVSPEHTEVKTHLTQYVRTVYLTVCKIIIKSQ